MAKREALVVATGTYSDARLQQLRSPAQDAEAMARVLGDARIGMFAVTQLVDPTEPVLRRKLHSFFSRRSRDDLLVLHLSCHGVKDDDGQLYFATSDTTPDQLQVTAVPATFLNDQMERCRARSIILMLDCCYAGAFAAGAKGDTGVHLKEKLGGQGRAVLTASNAIEYSWSGAEVVGEPCPSVFTAAIVEGLETGVADRDGDGWVSLAELHDHVTERMLQAERKQTPLKWEMGIEGRLYVARTPGRAEPEPPDGNASALTMPLPRLPRIRAPVGARPARPRAPFRPPKASREAPAPVAPPPAPVPARTPEQQAPRTPAPPPPPRRQPRRRRSRMSPMAAVTTVLGLVLLALVGVLVVTLLDGPPGDEEVQVVEVSGRQLWTDTGIDVVAGDNLRLTATGEICDNALLPDQCFEPDGVPDTTGQHPGDPFDLNHAALVGRIGTSEPFFVGAALSVTVPISGRLFLGVNDDPLDDNDGAFQAEVQVTPGAAPTGR